MLSELYKIETEYSNGRMIVGNEKRWRKYSEPKGTSFQRNRISLKAKNNNSNYINRCLSYKNGKKTKKKIKIKKIKKI